MGAEPWLYFVPYHEDTNVALQELKQREFEAGRYNPVMPFLADILPPGPDAPAPGTQHASIAEALEAAAESGTRSVLDMERVGREPGSGVVVPLPAAQVSTLFGTEQPTREMIEDNMDFFEDIERGQGLCITVYKDGRPSELCFAGYSYD
jgi:hypothetical protein